MKYELKTKTIFSADKTIKDSLKNDALFYAKKFEGHELEKILI